MNIEVLQPPSNVVDLREVMAQLWQRRLWLGLSVLLLGGVMAFAAFKTTPVYRSTSVLVPESQARHSMNSTLTSALGQLGGLATLAGINVGSSDIETEEALAVLKSREFTQNFIIDRQLMPILFALRWDAASGRWKGDPAHAPTLAKGYEYFDKKVRTVTQDKKTGLVSLQIDWKDRVAAADWANDLVRRLNAEMRARAIAKADASVGYLEKELAATSEVGTREAISRLIEAEIRQRMLANVTAEYAFGVVDRALAADADDPVKPKKATMIAAGILLGLGIGAFAALALPRRT